MKNRFVALLAVFAIAACSQPTSYDLILRGGTVYDGSGEAPFVGDVAVVGDKIVALGNLGDATAEMDIDVTGFAVAPGFINMMSWANLSLIEDGHSQSDIRQGITLEVMGEGNSMGPLNDVMRAEMIEYQDDIRFDVDWTTLDEYLVFLEERGVSTNVASFIGAATPRKYVIGYEDRPPTDEELEQMKVLVREAMEDGAIGVASSLMYPPGLFAETDELVELSKVAAEYDGMYASHMRDEGTHLIPAIDEVLTIAREANIRAEIYHLKSSGAPNWPKFDQAIVMIEAAQAEGLEITADVYTYPAGATGLNTTVPPWVQEGGFEKSLQRMADPELRARIIEEMQTPSDAWDNMYLMAGSPENILMVGFRNDDLKPLTGKTVAEVAEMRGTPAPETILDLIVEDGSRIESVFFSQSEDIVARVVALPWSSFNTDEASVAPEGVFLNSNPHPRAYGSMTRVLSKYVREDGLLSMQEAIRKLAALPAQTMRLDRRGELKKGFYADLVVFDPETIQDHATFTDPHQYSTGMIHVFVNGGHVIKDGEHTGATPGRVVRGPGWTGRAN